MSKPVAMTDAEFKRNRRRAWARNRWRKNREVMKICHAAGVRVAEARQLLAAKQAQHSTS